MEQHSIAGACHSLERRPWPTEKMRPGESVADYCRRLDVYENGRAGAAKREGS